MKGSIGRGDYITAPVQGRYEQPLSNENVYNYFMWLIVDRKSCIRIRVACLLAVTVSACTPAAVPEPSGAIPAEIADTATATIAETSTAPPQPTYSPVPPSPTAPDPTSVSANPSPHPPTAAPTADSVPTRFVIDPDQSNISYGVGETFLSEGNRYNYAVGRTSVVSGEIMLDSNNPAASTVGEITIDISAFQSDKSRRDKAIRDRWLQSTKFPLAVFSPTELRGLPQSYTPGEVIDFEMSGDLLVRDISLATVFTVSVSWEGERLTGEAVARVQMTDFGFEPPTVAGLIDAENDVDITFEFVALRDN